MHNFGASVVDKWVISRFNTFEELEKGVNFSIIKLNGAKSEHTHIYVTKHSFWYVRSKSYYIRTDNLNKYVQ